MCSTGLKPYNVPSYQAVAVVAEETVGTMVPETIMPVIISFKGFKEYSDPLIQPPKKTPPRSPATATEKKNTTTTTTLLRLPIPPKFLRCLSGWDDLAFAEDIVDERVAKQHDIDYGHAKSFKAGNLPGRKTVPEKVVKKIMQTKVELKL